MAPVTSFSSFNQQQQKKSNLPRLIYASETKKHLVTTKEAREMNDTTSGFAGVLEALKNKMEILDKEIKADAKGKKDYDEELFRLNKKKQDLLSKLKETQDWIDNFESKIKPLEGKYGEATKHMQGQYDDAKLKHANGIQVLIDNFDYHPEYKRFSDTFSAVPFRPK